MKRRHSSTDSNYSTTSVVELLDSDSDKDNRDDDSDCVILSSPEPVFGSASSSLARPPSSSDRSVIGGSSFANLQLLAYSHFALFQK